MKIHAKLASKMMVASALAVLPITTAIGQAAVITFDDLPNAGSLPAVPNGYGGLNWSNFSYLAGASSPNSGYPAAVISPANVAFNSNGFPASMTVSSPTAFNFNSAYFTAAWNDNLQVNAVASRNGVPLYTTSFILSATAPTLESLNFLGVDSITFTSSGGTPHPAYVNFGAGVHFAVDNINIDNPVPEPSTPGLMGLAAILCLRRRRE